MVGEPGSKMQYQKARKRLSLAVQWLRLHFQKNRGGFDPSRRTTISHAVLHSQKIKELGEKRKRKGRKCSVITAGMSKGQRSWLWGLPLAILLRQLSIKNKKACMKYSSSKKTTLHRQFALSGMEAGHLGKVPGAFWGSGQSASDITVGICMTKVHWMVYARSGHLPQEKKVKKL